MSEGGNGRAKKIESNRCLPSCPPHTFLVVGVSCARLNPAGQLGMRRERNRMESFERIK